jgi:hypothetical protein
MKSIESIEASNMINADIVNKMAGEHLYSAVHAWRKMDYLKVDARIERTLTACEALISPTEFNNREFKTTFLDVVRLEVKHMW